MLCCCDAICLFQIASGGGSTRWKGFLDLSSASPSGPFRTIESCERSGGTHVSRQPTTRRRPIQYMPVVQTGMSIIEFLASTIFAIHRQVCRTCHEITTSRHQRVKVSYKIAKDRGFKNSGLQSCREFPRSAMTHPSRRHSHQQSPGSGSLLMLSLIDLVVAHANVIPALDPTVV